MQENFKNYFNLLFLGVDRAKGSPGTRRSITEENMTLPPFNIFSIYTDFSNKHRLNLSLNSNKQRYKFICERARRHKTARVRSLHNGWR